MQYDYFIIFTKHTNLMQYYNAHTHDILLQHHCSPSCAQRVAMIKQRYAKEQDVQLILLVRAVNGEVFCKIRCPINPLPITGEFQTPTMPVLKRFLQEQGWHERALIPMASMD